MIENLISYGISFSFLGLLLSACIALFQKKTSVISFSGVLLFLSGLIGTIASLTFLFVSEQKNIVFFESEFLLGMKFSLTALSAVFFALVSGVSTLVSLYSMRYVYEYKETYHVPSLNFLTAFFILGMLGVLVSNNSLGFLFFWEIMSLSSFFLVMADRSKESVRAALLYLVMTHIGAGAILAGFLIVGQGAASVDFETLRHGLSTLSPAMSTLSILLFVFGFGSKAGLVPFHVWLPEAHPQAPSHISALMSGVMLKVAIYGFLRVFFLYASIPQWIYILIIVLGLFSAVFGVLYSILERDIKRALAYSSIENIGLIFVMLGTGLYFLQKSGVGVSNTSYLAVGNTMVFFGLFHAVNHALFKSGLFLSAGTIIHAVHSRSLERMGGLAKRLPLFSGIFLVLSLAASALPPFGPFFGEWGFLQSLMDVLRNTVFSSSDRILGLILLSLFALVAGLALFALVKIFAISMLGAPRSEHALHSKKAPALLVWPIAVLGFFTVLSGIAGQYVFTRMGHIPTNNWMNNLNTQYAVLSPWFLLLVAGIVLGLTFAAKKLFASKEEKVYHTWDCGQAIDASMEYTATAFSAPIRFFSRFLLKVKKEVVATPVLASNPWIATRTSTLNIRSLWYERLFAPTGRLVLLIAQNVRKLQNGRIQFYIFLLFVTLVLTLIIAL